MTTTVARRYRFRATHSLPDFPEPWCFPHQHDYTLEVVVAGGTSTDIVDELWDQIAVHEVANLNSLWEPSTVENIAENLLTGWFDEIAIAVTVWEDASRWGRAER